MSVQNANPMLAADELNPTDRAILDQLHDHPATPMFIAQETDYTSGNVRARLNHLKSHDHVENIGGGMWDVTNDPRDD